MIFLLGNLNAKAGRDGIFKPTIVNESLHEIIIDNRVRVVNYATSERVTVKSAMFPHCDIGCLLMVKCTIRSCLDG
jgi:hypothetical protein